MEKEGVELQTDAVPMMSDSSLLHHQSRRPSLSSLQIPTRTLESALSSSTKTDGPTLSSPGSTRGLPPRPHSTKVKSSMKNLLSDRSFRTKTCSEDSEKRVLIVSDTLSSDNGPLDNKPSTSRSHSLNKILFPSSSKAAHSLPVTPIANSGAENVHGRHVEGGSDSNKSKVNKHMTRSFSVPVNVKAANLRPATDSRRLVRVISARPQPATTDGVSTRSDSMQEIVIEDASEDIPEEEAVCRICLVELAEGGDTLRMDCSCKGELALAHQDCAVKWFSIKGNKTCDVCKQDVRNLPVTLLKISSPPTVVRHTLNASQQRAVTNYRIWQDVPVLVLVSMLAYFCFLEELLVSDLGPRALAISLPFSCILGLLSSIIASTMVSRSYIWAYACFQFAFVILFAHIFYSILNVSAVFSVLLSTFTGFGIAISMNSLLMEYIRWETNRQIRSSNQHIISSQQQQETQRQPHQLQRMQQEQHQ